MVEQTPKKHNFDASNSINCLADANAAIATQELPQAATMLKLVFTNTLIFDGKNVNLNFSFENLIHTMLKKQLEMTETMKINHFHAHLRKEGLQTIKSISASNNKTPDDVLIVSRRKYIKQESKASVNHKWHKFTFYPIKKSLSDLLEELNECAERALVTTPNM